ncbi:MAG: hypothetical protein BRC24_00505 [Parcubacteria group bacterium SW_4_46_8]|jgi:heme/copper-type cytochrome/quinol oxidase subunit 4|nr:MAG: hypothetical protein BRC24_00505 [Parcubacteria group bacterium SW_4_46_8]
MNFATFVNEMINVFNIIIPGIVVLSLITFLWHLLKYTFQSTNPNERKEARIYLMYAFLGLIVMTSLWGILRLLVGAVTFPSV